MGIQVVFGCPGTGKTQRLLDILEYEMANGVEPDRIAFVSFTRKAAQTAVSRAIDHFRLRVEDFPHFRTLHSLAYRMLGISHEEVMQPQHYTEIGELLGIEFTTKKEATFEDGPPGPTKLGDLFLFVDGFARSRGMSPRAAWDLLNQNYEMDWYEFKRYCGTVAAYKQEYGLLDFSDFLKKATEPLDVDVAIIDEAQDLSTLQWQFALGIFKNVKRIYIAGDDDQAIYSWSGADVRYFLNLPGEKLVLDQSYRIPGAVHRVAEDIASRITGRYPKVYKPRGEEGVVEYYRSPDDVDLSSGSWFILARNKYHLGRLCHLMRNHGFYFSFRDSSSVIRPHIDAIMIYEKWRRGSPVTMEETMKVNAMLPKEHRLEWPKTIWHEALKLIPLEDREFYISLLRRGEKIQLAPRIHINTIHGVKGGEADHVMLTTDMTQKTHAGMQLMPNAEHRVWYVGATRCRESLHIVLPQSKLYYEI